MKFQDIEHLIGLLEELPRRIPLGPWRREVDQACEVMSRLLDVAKAAEAEHKAHKEGGTYSVYQAMDAVHDALEKLEQIKC